jgi:hypothetical protein
LGLLGLGALVLAFSYATAAWLAVRSRDQQEQATILYLASIPFIVITLSWLIGFRFRFSYFVYVNWTIILLIGYIFSRGRWRYQQALLSGTFLALCVVSLFNYYRLIERKYPGVETVHGFLGEEADLTKIYVDEWGGRVRSKNYPPNENYVDLDLERVPLPHPDESFYMVLYGRPEVAAVRADAWANSNRAPTAPKLVRSWISLEMAERSVHLYRYDGSSGADEKKPER